MRKILIVQGYFPIISEIERVPGYEGNKQGKDRKMVLESVLESIIY